MERLMIPLMSAIGLSMARAVALAALLLAGLGAAFGAELEVRPVLLEDMKSVFATVETADVVSARARNGGTVATLSIDEGARVSEGQTIAYIGDPKLALRMNAIKARIDSVRSQRKLAATALERARTLLASGTIAQKSLDEAQTAFDMVEREFTALTAEQSVITEQQKEGEVRSPTAGRVTKVHVTQGAVVLPGEAIATIAAKGFILRLQLPERHARFIKQGDGVIVGEGGLGDGAAAGPSRDASARRTGIIQQVYPELRQGRVIADVAVEGLGDFFVGERVRVMIGTGRRQALVIPDAYLVRRFGLTFATLKGVGEVVVQIGVAATGGIEVLSGLQPGDVLIMPDHAE